MELFSCLPCVKGGGKTEDFDGGIVSFRRLQSLSLRFAAASSLNEGAFLRRFPLEDARRRYIRLRPQVRLADALEDKARGVDAHIVHINLHGGDRRVHEHGKRIIIKGQQRHVLRDLQSPAADVLQTVQRKMVVCAEQHLRPHAAGE